MSPSHRLQLCTNSPSMGPSYGVQSFRNRLLQRRSPMGSQALPANLLWHGLLSSQVRKSWQEPAAARAPHGVTHSLLQISTCSGVGSLSRAAGGDLLHCGPPWAAGGQPASPWSFINELHFTDLGVCIVVSLTSSHSSLSTVVLLLFFSPLLNDVITEALPPSLIGLALASGGPIFELAGTGFIRHGGSFSQKPPL